jgi:glycosyltransferase involved in cell wall biosynthesis
MKVLIVTENCSRKMGGEAILPYHYFRVLKEKDCDVKMLVHERNKAELLELFPNAVDDIFFITDTELQKAMWTVGEKLPKRVADVSLFFLVYLSSSYRMKKRVKSLVMEYGIDIVHQVIPVSPKTPSFIFDVGAPVIIGPMNGGMEFPPAFKKQIRSSERIAYSLAKSLGAVANWFIPGKKNAALLLAANQRTERVIRQMMDHPKNVRLLVENGVDLDLWKAAISEVPTESKPTFVFIGRLVDWKGVHYLLKAFHQLLKKQPAELIIIGDGEEQATLVSQAKDLGIASHVTFMGFVKQDEIPLLLGKARALVLPSLYECGGAVVLEAMALGKAVIATEWGGPADYIDPSCGILVKPESEEKLVEGLFQAMDSLAADRAYAEELGKRGRLKVEMEFNWRKKVEVVLTYYKQILSSPAKEA